MNISIKLNKELKKQLHETGTFTSIEMYEYLSTVDGVKFNRDIPLKNLSADLLIVNNHQVEEISIDTIKNTIDFKVLDDEVKNVYSKMTEF